MKKIAIILAASMAMTAGSAVFAADTATYVGGENNKVTVGDDISGYSTVLITSKDDNTIAYINQAAGVFEASMDFLLKNDSKDGDYTVSLGNEAHERKEITFTLSSEEPVTPVEETEMMQLEGSESYKDGYKNLAFVAEDVKLGQYDAIKIVVGEGDDAKIGGFKLSDILGTQFDKDAEVNFGLQINNVPDSVTITKVSLAVYDKDNSSDDKAWPETEGE